jgi:hypothetical protein
MPHHDVSTASWPRLGFHMIPSKGKTKEKKERKTKNQNKMKQNKKTFKTKP